MQVYRLTIQYNGSSWSGWQRQLGVPTIQEKLEDALTELFGGEKIVCHASGRTDAGVHALAQVVSFRAETPRDPDRMRLGLNTMLPPSISVVEMMHAPADFHARFSAHGKTYRYVILDRRDRSPFHHDRALHVRVPFDWRAVEAALPALVGTHDFTAFRGAGCTAKSPVRTIRRAEHIPRGEEHWIEFEGQGFLRYQVRRMVGTLLDIGKGRHPPERMAEVIASKDREKCGRTVLAGGLYLVSVTYPEHG